MAERKLCLFNITLKEVSLKKKTSIIKVSSSFKEGSIIQSKFFIQRRIYHSNKDLLLKEGSIIIEGLKTMV